MSNRESFTNVRSLIGAVAQSLNLIDSDMQHHHEQTAYLAFMLAEQMGLEGDDLNMSMFVAMLHDIGSVIVQDSKEQKETPEGRRRIARIGATMLRELRETSPIADIIEIVQNSYEQNHAILGECAALDISQAVHMADYVTTRIDDDLPPLSQVKGILALVEEGRGSEFSPKAVDALNTLSVIEAMWMNITWNPWTIGLFTGTIADVSLEDTLHFTRFLSKIIDFRSPFTAMHSAGVAATARELARLAGMSEDEIIMMDIAGNLHDLGKLRVPNEILEKPGKLDDEEFNIIKEHTYYTFQILGQVDGFDTVAQWAAFHHEKLNGRGYPFHLDADMLDVGSRIMAVADIFAAITEIRPYRDGMSREKALAILHENVERGEICGDVVDLLESHYDEVDKVRREESALMGQRYFRSLEMGDKIQ